LQASADVRYSFTGQYLLGAALFARKALDIEANYSKSQSADVQNEHRSLVTTAIIQCIAALETEAHEICVHGPGSYLGSDGVDKAAQEFLRPLADIIDRQEVLERYVIILHLLDRPGFDRGTEPFQSAKLVVRLRNELVHYKSQWGTEMTATRLFKALQNLQHRPPPFTQPSMNFFPHRCLSGDCSAWAVQATISFLEAVYVSLGVPSRFDEHYRERLQV
jgi:hypothetical protein